MDQEFMPLPTKADLETVISDLQSLEFTQLFRLHWREILPDKTPSVRNLDLLTAITRNTAR
jgi:hypothetical protein